MTTTLAVTPRAMTVPLLPARRLLLQAVAPVVERGRRAAAWPVASQQGSRRNAMLGATEIRRRRHEQEEVEAFFASYRPPRRTSATG